NAESGLRLPATLIFDHPTPTALADHIHTQLTPPEKDPSEQLLAELERVESELASLAGSTASYDAINERLNRVMRKWNGIREDSVSEASSESFEEASDDELFEALDSELGAS
ncbi:beta-ketoacyl synthase, partial [Streptomyces sp. NPDC006643]